METSQISAPTPAELRRRIRNNILSSVTILLVMVNILLLFVCGTTLRMHASHWTTVFEAVSVALLVLDMVLVLFADIYRGLALAVLLTFMHLGVLLSLR